MHLARRMAPCKSSLDLCESQVNKCSTSLSRTVASRAGTSFFAKPFTSQLKAVFRSPLITEATLSVFLRKIDSAVENQRKTGVGKGNVCTCFRAAARTRVIRAGL